MASLNNSRVMIDLTIQTVSELLSDYGQGPDEMCI